MSEFSTIGVIAKLHDPRAAQTLAALCGHLLKLRRKVLVEDSAVTGDLPTSGVSAVPREELARRCDLVVVVGGDGTLLDAGRSLAPAGIPILGVNQGRLGFMVDIAPAEMAETLDEVLRGKYVRERRQLLSAAILRDDGRSGPYLAINDVVIRNQAAVRMLEFETWMDGEFISQHRADGIIVATPTGSTAYALSGGGPVVHPGLEAMTLVPICPHTLSDRPVVVGSDRVVRIVLGGSAEARAMCTCDGHDNENLAPGDAVEVTRSNHVLQLIHPNNYNYFNILRNKLHWGRGRTANSDRGG